MHPCKAQFVCCRENPELHPPKPVVQLESTDHEIVIEAASSSTKGIVVYEVEPFDLHFSGFLKRPQSLKKI